MTAKGSFAMTSGEDENGRELQIKPFSDDLPVFGGAGGVVQIFGIPGPAALRRPGRGVHDRELVPGFERNPADVGIRHLSLSLHHADVEFTEPSKGDFRDVGEFRATVTEKPANGFVLTFSRTRKRFRGAWGRRSSAVSTGLHRGGRARRGGDEGGIRRPAGRAPDHVRARRRRGMKVQADGNAVYRVVFPEGSARTCGSCGSGSSTARSRRRSRSRSGTSACRDQRRMTASGRRPGRRGS